jgi:EAL domain-containing protein (putative c-di-GMP-specific phosphodiesterase class I)
VLRTACIQAAHWPQQVGVAVNLSAMQFTSRNLVQLVINALAMSGLPAGRLELEITESVLLQDETNTINILHQLREIGVQISMDDFGTGYSSLAYLRNFPFDKIKIDRSFVRVRAVVGLARSLGISTTSRASRPANSWKLPSSKAATRARAGCSPRPCRIAISRATWPSANASPTRPDAARLY